MLLEIAAAGRLITKNAEPITVATKQPGRTTRTSAITSSGPLSEDATLEVTPPRLTANTQTTVNSLVFIADTIQRHALPSVQYIFTPPAMAPGIQAFCCCNNRFNLGLQGTVEGMTYSVLSTTSLHATNNWATEKSFPGASHQFWTPVSIPLSGRPNLFRSARSWIDSNGSGIPDWWLLQYFGRTDIAPYALCSSGDGWTILQAWQNGWDPALFYTPPAPQGLTANYHVAECNATVSWNPSPGG